MNLPGTGLVLLSFLGPAVAQVQWTPEVDLAARSEHSLVFDPVRQRTVLFGGGGARNDLWEWDGTVWQRRLSATTPPGRSGHAATFDPVRGRMVVFGGLSWDGTTTTSFDDTWEWDGAVWTQATPAQRPSPRSGARLAFDSARGRAVLFGGMIRVNSLTIALDDTWEWDGTTWTQRNPSTRPPGRWNQAFSEDPVRGRVVMFGGFGPLLPIVADTWEWDGTDWTRSAALAPALSTAGTCFDVARGRTLALGTVQPRNQPPHMETWEFDGTSWQMVQQGTPESAYYVALAHDPTRARTVLFGGPNGGETHEFDGTGWTRIVPRQGLASPFGTAPSVAFDTGHGVAVMVLDTYPGMVETWEHASVGWSLRSVVGPYLTIGQAMAYDPVRARTVLFGGQSPYGNDQTWTWDGTAWVQLSPSPAPPPLYGHSMAFDPSRGRVVVFGTPGNSGLGVTWEWDGSSWVQRLPVHVPAGRRFAAMTWHAGRQRMLLYGGGEGHTTGSLFADLWEWDGSDWTQLAASVPPGARTEHLMVFDRVRDRLVVHGGRDWRDPRNDTWEWDGTTWLQRTPATRPGAWYRIGMVFDEPRGVTLLVGGVSYSTWTYGSVFPAAAAAFGSGCLGSAGVPQLVNQPGSLPWLGGTYRQELTRVPASSVALIDLGVSDQHWYGLPLPFDLTPIGMTGCRQLVSTEVVTALPTGTGTAVLTLGVPNDAALLGATFYTQAFALDAAANPFGGTMSNGLASRIGGR